MSKNLKKHIRHAKHVRATSNPGKLKWKTTQNNVNPAKSKTEPGRNDPCSCGSGLKYKKCCMQKVVTKGVTK